MSDATSTAYKEDRESVAENELAEAIVVFLENNPTAESRNILNTAIETATSKTRLNTDHAKGIILRLEENDREEWRKFYNSQLFTWRNEDVKDRLLKEAEKRKIGESKWIL